MFLPKGEIYDSFLSTTYSMGIAWGVIFTLTMFAMCLFPYITIHSKLKRVYRDGEIIEDEELKQWVINLQDNFLIYKNLKSLISVLSPAIIGMISSLV
jgi:hypothetical protein